MAAPASLVPELEDMIRHGAPRQLARMLERITALFVDGARRFNDDHVRLFDDLLGRLLTAIDAEARAELSCRLAPIGNAPIGVVRRLAEDDDIAVAGPVLERSQRLAERDLVAIAESKGQGHLLAISARLGIAESVTAVLVRRGDQEVVRSIIANRAARFSDDSFSTLVDRAAKDDTLAHKIACRADIPPRFISLLAKVSTEHGASGSRGEYSAAQVLIDSLRQEDRLDEALLVDFANGGRFEQTVAALASLCNVPIDVVDRVMTGERHDPVLILCKSAGWGWPTARAIIMAQPGSRGKSSYDLDAAFSSFECLSSATARRVLRFWQSRR